MSVTLRNSAGGEQFMREETEMANQPSQPKTGPASKSGLKQGQGAPPPQSKAEHAGPKRQIEEEDMFGGGERTHDGRVNSKDAKP